MGQQVLDTRELATGKDGRLFVEAGSVNMLMAEINTFSVNMDVKSVEKQPVGDILVHDVPTGVAYTLTFTEMVVRDDLIMEPLLAEIQQGRIPSFNFQGAVTKPDSQEQRLSFNKATPKGSFGLQNVTPGEVIEREQSFALNEVPRFITSLASTYLK